MNSLNPTLVNDDALTYNLEDSTPKMVETVDIDEPKTTTPSVAPVTSNIKPPSSRLKKKEIPFWTESRKRYDFQSKFECDYTNSSRNDCNHVFIYTEYTYT